MKERNQSIGKTITFRDWEGEGVERAAGRVEKKEVIFLAGPRKERERMYGVF